MDRDVEIGALLSTGAARRTLGKRSVIQMYRLLVQQRLRDRGYEVAMP
ncbi:MAG: hypothetical protein ACRDSR_22065 [Pseudonocardiaceae bacterium]